MRHGEFPGESLLQRRPKGTKRNPGILASPEFPASASHISNTAAVKSVLTGKIIMWKVSVCVLTRGEAIEPEPKTALQVKTTLCISVAFRLGHSQDMRQHFINLT